jgi:hypothetical protein
MRADEFKNTHAETLQEEHFWLRGFHELPILGEMPQHILAAT